jgi:uncharacterized protein YdaU (DUF1376 family)
MKFYPRDPDAFFGGTAGMTLEQIGAYTLIIDRLYALDGVMPDDDAEMAHALHLDPRLWHRIKNELMAKGKIRVTTDGMLEANGVRSRLLVANMRSTSAKHAADVRWRNYRKTKENNDPLMRPGNASKSISIYSEISSEPEKAKSPKAAEVDNEFDRIFSATPKRSQQIPVSSQLAAKIKAGWGR